jgi:hypothetical protein
VCPKDTQSSGLILREVIFRRHSGIDKGETMNAAQLDTLWGSSTTPPQDLYGCEYPTRVKVLNNTRHVQVCNAPIKPRSDKVMRTTQSKLELKRKKSVNARKRQEKKVSAILQKTTNLISQKVCHVRVCVSTHVVR